MINSQITVTKKKKRIVLHFIIKDVYLLTDTIKSINKQARVGDNISHITKKGLKPKYIKKSHKLTTTTIKKKKQIRKKREIWARVNKYFTNEDIQIANKHIKVI